MMYSEGATQAQIDLAKGILEALEVAYPAHPWAVRVYGDSTGGGFFIRHLDFPSNWGMNCRQGTRQYSASALKKEVILMAGEWLERAGLKRGAWDGESIKRVEGVPEKYQPGKPIENLEVVIEQQQERTEPWRSTG
jgi:hypothetical protein